MIAGISPLSSPSHHSLSGTTFPILALVALAVAAAVALLLPTDLSVGVPLAGALALATRVSWQGLPSVAGVLVGAIALIARGSSTGGSGSDGISLTWVATGSVAALLGCVSLALLVLFPLMRFPPPTGPHGAVLGTIADEWVYDAVVVQEAPGVGLELLAGGFVGCGSGTISSSLSPSAQRVQRRRLTVQFFYPATAAPAPARCCGVTCCGLRARAPVWSTGGTRARAESRLLLHEFATKLMELPTWLGWWPLSHLADISSPFVTGAQLLAPRLVPRSKRLHRGSATVAHPH